MPKWKLKIKGSGTPPVVPDSGGGGADFNTPDGQYGGGANGRMAPHPHSGKAPDTPSGPVTTSPTVKKRAHFPMPRSSRNTGRNVKTTPRYPTA